MVSILFLWFSTLPIRFLPCWGHFQARHLHLISTSTSYSKIFYSSLARSKCMYTFSFSLIFSLSSIWNGKIQMISSLYHCYIIIIIIIIYSFRAFHISISWWCFNGVWVRASLFKSPALFSVFWSFSIMLSFGWFPLFCQRLSHPVPLVIL